MQANDTPSRHINLWRSVKGRFGPLLNDRLHEIQAEIEAIELRGAARSIAANQRFKSCVRAICLDLFHAYEVDPSMVTGVHRDKTRLGKNAAYPSFVTAPAFLHALKGLQAIGYVEEVAKGTQGSGKTTRVKATPHLIRKLTISGFSKRDIISKSKGIRLAIGHGKNEPKVPTAYADTSETNRWQANLDIINTEIGQHIIGLDRTHAQLEEIEQQRRAAAIAKGDAEKRPYDYQRLDMDAVKLYRVFNSPNWQDGGRFYGGWWQNVPKECRRFITIDGKETCEYDYSSIHPMLLYAKSGHTWPASEDFYEAPHGPALRDTVKATFLIMLNMKGNIQARQVPSFDSTTAGMTWKQFVRGIVKTYAPIKEHLATGVGTQLQRMDADIAEAVMLRFTKSHYACLPVHDSFITLDNLGDELADYMKHVILEKLGIEVNVEAKPKHAYAGSDSKVDTDISNHLNPTDPNDIRHLHWLFGKDEDEQLRD